MIGCYLKKNQKINATSFLTIVQLDSAIVRTLNEDRTVEKSSKKFNKTVSNEKAIDELTWWLSEITHARRNIYLPLTGICSNRW